MSTLMMMRDRVSALLLLISVLGTMGMAATTNSTAPKALSVHATIQSIGIVAPYSGDNNNNNSASVRYRVNGSSTWMNGPEMMADRNGKQWRVSLVGLSPNTSYEVQVQFGDPDGLSPTTVTKSIRTRPDYPGVGNGGTIRYVPDQGSLQSVIKAAAPGDTVRIRGGVYYTFAELTTGDSGQPGKYITIEPVPGNNVILDGSDPSLNNPSVDNWKLYQSNIYYTQLSWGSRSCGSRSSPNYVGEQRNGHDVRYLFYLGTSNWSAFVSAPRGKALYDCGGNNPGRLYVVTYDGVDPDNREIHVSKYESGLMFSGTDYIRVRNLEFRYYALFGVHLRNSGADYNIIENNTFHNIGRYHIRVGNGSLPGMSAYNLIQDNYFYETGYRDSRWTWDQQKSAAEGAAVFVNYSGPGNVIRRNTIVNLHDGMTVGRQSPNTDVYQNIVRNCMDDGLQLDVEPGYNIRVWSNKIEYCYTGISAQDWYEGKNKNAGPVYVFRNVIQGGKDPHGRKASDGSTRGYDTTTAFKIGGSSQNTGRLYLYHNTISIANPSGQGYGIQDSGGKYFSGIVSRNNLWRVQNRVFSLKDPGTTVGHSLNCDNAYHLNSSGELFFWGGTKYSGLSQFQQGTNQESNAISHKGTLLNPDFTLKSGSPEVDKGCIITGFNDRGPWIYKGTKPDIGAFESLLSSSANNLSGSTKTASQTSLKYGETTEFTIRLINDGPPLSNPVTLVDTIPDGLEIDPNSVQATLGSIQVQKADSTSLIQWQGQLNNVSTVEIRFKAKVTIRNTRILESMTTIDDGSGGSLTLWTSVTVNVKPLHLPIIGKK